MSNVIRDPDYQNKIRDSFPQQHFMKTIGASISNLGPGLCELTMPFSNTLTQQNGFLHAGVVTSLADSAAGYAALSLSPPNSSVLSTEFKVNLLSPAKGETFIARAKVLKSGKTLTIVFAELFAVEGGQETLCSVFMGTMIIRPQ